MRWLTTGLLVAFAFNVLLHTRFSVPVELVHLHVARAHSGVCDGSRIARVASRRAGTATAMGVAMLLLFMLVCDEQSAGCRSLRA